MKTYRIRRDYPEIFRHQERQEGGVLSREEIRDIASDIAEAALAPKDIKDIIFEDIERQERASGTPEIRLVVKLDRDMYRAVYEGILPHEEFREVVRNVVERAIKDNICKEFDRRVKSLDMCLENPKNENSEYKGFYDGKRKAYEEAIDFIKGLNCHDTENTAPRAQTQVV